MPALGKYTRSTTHRMEQAGVVLVAQVETSIEVSVETKPAKDEQKKAAE